MNSKSNEVEINKYTAVKTPTGHIAFRQQVFTPIFIQL